MFKFVPRVTSGSSLFTMDGNDVTSDQVVAELVDMGFDISDITEAIKTVGPSLDNAIEFILNGSSRNDRSASTSLMCTTDKKVTRKRAISSLQPSAKLRQRNITEHLNLASGPKRSKTRGLFNTSVSNANLSAHVEEPDVSLPADTGSHLCQDIGMVPSYCKDEKIIELGWEKKVNNLLQKNFGYSTLKSFQKEALGAWLANQDCLVLAATGSGTSHLPLCSCLTGPNPLNDDIYFSLLKTFFLGRKIIMFSDSGIVIWKGGGGHLTIN